MALRDAETEARLAAMRAKLLAAARTRVRPGCDDKVLADWNGLMIAALANAADAFDRADWLEAAERAFNFVCTRMTTDGRLLHAYRNGEAKAPASSTDYANMIKARSRCSPMFSGETRYHRAGAPRLGGGARRALSGTPKPAAISSPPTMPRGLIVHPRRPRHCDAVGQRHHGWRAGAPVVCHRQAMPIGRAEALISAFAGEMTANVLAHAGLLGAALDLLAPTHIVLIAPEGHSTRALRRALADVSLPGAVVQEVREGATGEGALPPSSPAHGKTALDGKPTAYVCIGPQCSLPVTDAAALVGRRRRASGFGNVGFLRRTPSCPGLSRASTNFTSNFRRRDKPRHDAISTIAAGLPQDWACTDRGPRRAL